jgi:hypothetical protein
MLKKLLVAAAFVTVIAAPAFAQSYPGLNEAKAYPITASDSQHSAKKSYASAIESGSDIVVSGGKVIGQDPDPTVRLQLLRDANIGNVQ